MRRFCIVVATTLALSTFCGCKEKPKQVPKIDQIHKVDKVALGEAANLASEADFAMQVKDFPRAEKALARSVELDPDTPVYWINLGISRRKQGNSAGARAAYKKALSVSEGNYKREPADAAAALEQVHILLILGQDKDSRERLEKARRDHPADRDIRIFTEDKVLEQMVGDPELKALRP